MTLFLSREDEILLIAQDFAEEISSGASLEGVTSFWGMIDYADQMISRWPFGQDDVRAAARLWPTG